MGDEVIITVIEYIDQKETTGRELYQVDLYNKKTKENYRTFIDCDVLEKKLHEARGESGT